MLIELPAGRVSINNREVVEDFRINFAPNNQLRCKFNAIMDSGKIVPFDIVLYEWKAIMPFKGTIGALDILLNGIEMKSGNKIDCKLSYHIISKQWSVVGNIAKKDIDITTSGFSSIWMIINDIFLK